MNKGLYERRRLNSIIRKKIRGRLLRTYRYGLLKKKSFAEQRFEDILKRFKVDYIPQAGFFSKGSFYIVDFYIKNPYKIIVEIDDESHRSERKRLYDCQKIRYFKKAGFNIIKFSNRLVLNYPTRVQRRLFRFLKRRCKSY